MIKLFYNPKHRNLKIELMNLLMQLLFPERVKRERLFRLYDELEVGILLCKNMDDTCNMSWKVYKAMEPLKGIKDWDKCYNRLWKLLEMQREHVMSRKVVIPE